MADSFTWFEATRASLIRPLSEADVLVANETAYYSGRQHWASVVQPIYETFVFLLFIIWIIDVFASTGLSNPLVGLVLVLALVHALLLAFTGGRPPVSRLAVDPFSNPSRAKNVSRTAVLWVAASLLLGLIVLGLQVTAVFAVIGVITRLVIILARWSYYEKRYITNRRVIEAGGFLGSRISSMPLSRVTDISYSKSVPGELLGYATMRVETAGQDQALGIVRFISRPDHFYEVLSNFSAPPAPSAPKEPPQDP